MSLGSQLFFPAAYDCEAAECDENNGKSNGNDDDADADELLLLRSLPAQM